MIVFLSAREPDSPIMVSDVAPKVCIFILYDTAFVLSAEAVMQKIVDITSSAELEYFDIYRAEDVIKEGEELILEEAGYRIFRVSDTVSAEAFYEAEEVESGLKRIDVETVVRRIEPSKRLCKLEDYDLCGELEKRGLKLVNYSTIKKTAFFVAGLFSLTVAVLIGSGLVVGNLKEEVSHLRADLNHLKRSFTDKNRLYPFIARSSFDWEVFRTFESLPVEKTTKFSWQAGRFIYGGLLPYLFVPEALEGCEKLIKKKYTCQLKYRSVRGEQYEITIR